MSLGTVYYVGTLNFFISKNKPLQISPPYSNLYEIFSYYFWIQYVYKGDSYHWSHLISWFFSSSKSEVPIQDTDLFLENLMSILNLTPFFKDMGRATTSLELLEGNVIKTNTVQHTDQDHPLCVTPKTYSPFHIKKSPPISCINLFLPWRKERLCPASLL